MGSDEFENRLVAAEDRMKITGRGAGDHADMIAAVSVLSAEVTNLKTTQEYQANLIEERASRYDWLKRHFGETNGG